MVNFSSVTQKVQKGFVSLVQEYLFDNHAIPFYLVNYILCELNGMITGDVLLKQLEINRSWIARELNLHFITYSDFINAYNFIFDEFKCRKFELKKSINCNTDYKFILYGKGNMVITLHLHDVVSIEKLRDKLLSAEDDFDFCKNVLWYKKSDYYISVYDIDAVIFSKQVKFIDFNNLSAEKKKNIKRRMSKYRRYGYYVL